MASTRAAGKIARDLGPYEVAGAPSAGTDEVQTITIGGTPTGGTFKLQLPRGKQITGDITWSATNTTLLANIDAALEALSSVGTGGVATAAGTLTAGIGTITLTFAKRDVGGAITALSALTGTSPTIAVARTTPGAAATAAGARKGALLIDTTNGALYQNTGTSSAPTWTGR